MNPSKLIPLAGSFLFCLLLGLIPASSFPQESFLMVVDIQEFPVKNPAQKAALEEMIQHVNRLIDRFSPDKVIYIKAQGKSLSLSSRGFSVDTLPAPPFHPLMKVARGRVFTKTEGDAFTSEALLAFLKASDAKKIVLAGLMADKCILATAAGGVARGYDITIVPEGLLGTTPGKKDKAVKHMVEKGIKVVSLAEILRES